jgi:hypothetical protein
MRGLDVVAVFVKPGGICTTRTSFDPTQTQPFRIYAMKIAGSVAVEIQNETESKSDDIGYSAVGDPESDAAWIARITSYLAGVGMTAEQLQDFDEHMRAMVRRMLAERWLAVEALALEICRCIASGRVLEAAQIGELLGDADPAFYEAVKGHLRNAPGDPVTSS